MQELVGIVRREDEMQQALDGLAALRDRAARVSACRQPRIQSGMAHGARPVEPAHRCGSSHPLGHRAEGEPRRTFRDDYPEKDPDVCGLQHSCRRDGRRSMQSRASRFRECARISKQIIEENK